MKVMEAREIGRDWVNREGSQIPGFLGAMFGGSTNFRADNEPMPSTSDLDIMIWTETDNRSQFKKVVSGLIIEASLQPHGKFAQGPEAILGDFRYACHFAVPSVIADPTGHLTYLQQVVAREYARRKWVEKRCEHAHHRLVHDVLTGQMASWILSDTVPDQLFELYYAVMLTAQILTLADLRSPTIRKNLVVSREILKDHNKLELHEAMLAVLGVAGFDQAQVDSHFGSCRRAYDRALEVYKTPFFFSEDLGEDVRPIAVDGTTEILDMGFHREAMFWIHWVYSNAQKAIQNDAPEEEKAEYLNVYLRDLAQLGLETDSDFSQRKGMLKALLPQVMQTAVEIMDNNVDIKD